MHPNMRQALHDRMLRSASLYLKGKSISMRASGTRRIIRDELAVLEIPHRAGFLGAVAPAADANHLIVGGPIGEGIIRRVDDDQAAAVFDIVLKLFAQVRWPIGSVIVKNDHSILAELRLEAAEVLAKLRRSCDGHAEYSRVFQFFFQDGGGQLPGVIGTSAFSIHKKNGYRIRLGGGRRRRKRRAPHDRQENGNGKSFHAASTL